MADAGTTSVRPGFNFDKVSLARWLSENVDGDFEALQVRQFKGGQSNPTYLLTTPARSYVLRRKPPGRLLKGAHAVEREAEVLLALARANFPVPKVYGLCTEEEVIGSSFYVMERVEGRIFWDASFPDVGKHERAAYFESMNATMAELHLLDPARLGLNDFGKRGNYFQRQISRWSKQYLEDADAGRDPEMDRLVEWLPAHVPPGDETAIVHGDFRCDNIIFHPHEPRILAVLDWELSTIGHPLADFAYHSMMYRMPPQVVAGLRGIDCEALGIPSEAEYVKAYCRTTGRDGIPGYDFYVAFNLFRLAAIFHGIKGRIARGTAASASAKERVKMMPMLTALAGEAMDDCMKGLGS